MYFCVVDTETTGLEPNYHEVIEVAAIICDKYLNIVDKTSFRIKPQHLERAAKRALEINGYDPMTWNPDFSTHGEAYLYLNDFVKRNTGGEDITLFGQNIKFDKNFLLSGYKSAGISCYLDVPTADLMDMAKTWSKLKKIKLKGYSLKYLAEFTGVVNENPHAAEADAITTLEVLKWFIKEFKKESKHVRKVASRKSQIKIR